MRTFNEAMQMKRIKNQQAGRRLSGNQQRELTREQTRHPERVESTTEKMLEAGKCRDAGAGFSRVKTQTRMRPRYSRISHRRPI
jgi:hypothetical protein